MQVGVYTSCPSVTQLDALSPYPITGRTVPILDYEPTPEDWVYLERLGWLGPDVFRTVCDELDRTLSPRLSWVAQHYSPHLLYMGPPRDDGWAVYTNLTVENGFMVLRDTAHVPVQWNHHTLMYEEYPFTVLLPYRVRDIYWSIPTGLLPPKPPPSAESIALKTRNEELLLAMEAKKDADHQEYLRREREAYARMSQTTDRAMRMRARDLELGYNPTMFSRDERLKRAIDERKDYYVPNCIKGFMKDFSFNPLMDAVLKASRDVVEDHSPRYTRIIGKDDWTFFPFEGRAKHHRVALQLAVHNALTFIRALPIAAVYKDDIVVSQLGFDTRYQCKAFEIWQEDQGQYITGQVERYMALVAQYFERLNKYV